MPRPEKIGRLTSEGALRQSFDMFLAVTLRRDPMRKDKEEGHLERRAYRRSCFASCEGLVEILLTAAGESFVIVHLDLVRTEDWYLSLW